MKHLDTFELDNIQAWAEENNLKLNCAKSCEVVFTDPKRRRQHNDPPSIPGIMRCQKLKMLGVTTKTKVIWHKAESLS